MKMETSASLPLPFSTNSTSYRDQTSTSSTVDFIPPGEVVAVPVTNKEKRDESCRLLVQDLISFFRQNNLIACVTFRAISRKTVNSPEKIIETLLFRSLQIFA